MFQRPTNVSKDFKMDQLFHEAKKSLLGGLGIIITRSVKCQREIISLQIWPNLYSNPVSGNLKLPGYSVQK